MSLSMADNVSPAPLRPPIPSPLICTDDKSSDGAVAATFNTSDEDDEDKFYEKYGFFRKTAITAILALCAFNANLGGQIILPAMPEIATHFGTTGTIINISNALYTFFMGLSTLFWGPLSHVFGRRWVAIVSGVLYLCFSIGSALAPSLASLFVFRSLTAFLGTAFHVIGSNCISDIYKPTERGTAQGWYISGTLVAPSMGPFIAGIIVTYANWRCLFWFQSALGGLAMLLVLFFLPETSHVQQINELKGQPRLTQAKQILRWLNPLHVIALLFRPKILIASISASAVIWNMQTLLAPIRYVINPRFHLTSPLQSSFFFLAPGGGYILGTFLGGPWADHTVKIWIKKRGKRVPEDRLRSTFGAMGIIIPGSIFIYGWTIEKEKGGIPLPVICMFVQGVAQMMCLPSLNTYFLETDRARAAEVMASSFFFRFVIGAVGTAVSLPGIQSIGIGWISTITSFFVMASTGGLVYMVVFLADKKVQKSEV